MQWTLLILQALEKGLRFTIRDSGNPLGYGVVTDIYDEDTDMDSFAYCIYITYITH